MNILLINNINDVNGTKTVGGVEYHRQVKPNVVLKRNYPEFDFMMSLGVHDSIDDIIKQSDLVIFSRIIPPEAIEKLNNMGIKFGLDLDDWWHLPTTHNLYKHYQDNKIAERTVESIRAAHFVMVTTPFLAEQVRPYNENTYIIENGIDSQDEVWQPKKNPNKRLRFGFTQGNTHQEDIATIANKVNKSFKDISFYTNAQVVLTGFYQDNPNEITNERFYEMMLTEDLKAIRLHGDYVKELRLLLKPDGTNKPYRRIWAKDVTEFATVYNDIDVSVVPLIDNKFNNCKSELKMLEAGFMDCGVLVNHVKPYTLLATDKNSFDLNKKTFYEWQRFLLNNPNALEDSKGYLREDTLKYDLNLLSLKRKELYLKYK